MQLGQLPQIKLSEVNINLLGICGSPRLQDPSGYLLTRTLEYLSTAGGASIDMFDFAGKNIQPCTACETFCGTHKRCKHDDDFPVFLQKWLKADAILWSVPVYTMGPPAVVRAAMDRLGELVFQNWISKQGPFPYFNKVCGIIAEHPDRSGLQEYAIQSLLDHVILMDCIPVGGDMPENQLGVIAYGSDRRSIEENDSLLKQCYNLGLRVVETARIVKMGTFAIAEVLPEAYFYSRLAMGAVSRPQGEVL